MSDADQVDRLRHALLAHTRRIKAPSTGPKTAAGKAKSSANALKHGLAAEIIRDADELQRFRTRLARLRDDLQPEGEMEDILVERIAFATNALERADRLERETLSMARRPDDTDGATLLHSQRCRHALDSAARFGAVADNKLWRALRALKALQTERYRQAAIELEKAILQNERSSPETERIQKPSL